MTGLRLFFMLLIAAACAGCGRDAALDGLVDGGQGEVVAVASGDALILADGRRIELAGVAAPDLDQPFGAEAKAALERVAKGRQVNLLSAGDDSAVHVRDAGTRVWLQQALLSEGAVRVRTRPGEQALAREMLEAEAAARTRQKGLWGRPEYAVRLPREVVAERLEGFHVVEGRVLEVSDTAGRIYMEFNRPWRGGFSTETVHAQARDFEAAGLDLKALRGRLVRVRGEVRTTRYGPRLRLTHPEQVERLKDQPDDRR